MPDVEVVLYATLGKYHPEGKATEPFCFQIPEGTTVAGLLAALGIPPGESKQVFVNNRRREPGYVLQEGERVAIFPPIAGG